MKLLHILKSEPDAVTSQLMDIVSEGTETEVFRMYGNDVDYRKMVRLIFDADKNISWW